MVLLTPAGYGTPCHWAGDALQGFFYPGIFFDKEIWGQTGEVITGIWACHSQFPWSGRLLMDSWFLHQVLQVGLPIFNQLRQRSPQCWCEQSWRRDHVGAEAWHDCCLPRRSSALIALLFIQTLPAEGRSEADSEWEGDSAWHSTTWS